MSDLNYAQLMQVIQHSIEDGIKNGIADSRRRVTFRKWVKLEDKDLAPDQPFGSWGWSKDWFDGTLLETHSVVESEEISTVAIIEQLNGELLQVDISQVRVVR